VKNNAKELLRRARAKHRAQGKEWAKERLMHLCPNTGCVRLLGLAPPSRLPRLPGGAVAGAELPTPAWDAVARRRRPHLPRRCCSCGAGIYPVFSTWIRARDLNAPGTSLLSAGAGLGTVRIAEVRTVVALHGSNLLTLPPPPLRSPFEFSPPSPDTSQSSRPGPTQASRPMPRLLVLW
jgi:hypothetical protein